MPWVCCSRSFASASRSFAAASRARLFELAGGGGERSFQLVARGFLSVLRQATLEELADAGVLAQPPFPGAGRERLLERRGHATVDDLSHRS